MIGCEAIMIIARRHATRSPSTHATEIAANVCTTKEILSPTRDRTYKNHEVKNPQFDEALIINHRAQPSTLHFTASHETNQCKVA
jgi:hypothetical protein